MTPGVHAGPWLGALLLCACATAPPPPPSHRDRVILLPDADGSVGQIAVLRNGGETVLSEAYTSAVTQADGGIATQALDPAAVRGSYARELQGLPPRPLTDSFHFLPGSVRLTPESEAAAGLALAAVARRPAVEAWLVGHTDTVGPAAKNEQLGLTRALLIRARLVALGVSGFRIHVESRGEREPATVTADEVPEARNRRVELYAQ